MHHLVRVSCAEAELPVSEHYKHKQLQVEFQLMSLLYAGRHIICMFNDDLSLAGAVLNLCMLLPGAALVSR